MASMRQSRRRLTIALSTVGGIALGFMMFHTILSTVLRTVANNPIYGTYEMVESWYLPTIALVGLLAAHLQGEQIQVAALVERMPTRTQHPLKIAGAGLSAALCFFIAIFSLREGIADAAMGMTAGVTTIIIWPFILLVPVAFGVLSWFYIADLRAQLIEGPVRGTESTEDYATEPERLH